MKTYEHVPIIKRGEMIDGYIVSKSCILSMKRIGNDSKIIVERNTYRYGNIDDIHFIDYRYKVGVLENLVIDHWTLYGDFVCIDTLTEAIVDVLIREGFLQKCM